MAFNISKKDNYTLLKVQVEKLDSGIAPDLKSELVLINGNGEKNIVLDLEACTYCDSSGLRSILVANRLCEDAIGTLIVCGLQPEVENLIRISMLHTVLIITKTVGEAEDLLRQKEIL